MSLPVDLSDIVVCQKLTMVLVSIGTVILTLEDLTNYKNFKDKSGDKNEQSKQQEEPKPLPTDNISKE